MEKKICEAIQERLLVEFIYDGQLRVVEPYILGIHKDTSCIVLSAYQVGGHIERENSPLWKLYKLDKMSKLQVTNEKISTTRKGYRADDNRFSKIICNLNPGI